MPIEPSDGAGHNDVEARFRPYEAVEHTADLALLARGRTLEELFENAARGMMAFLVDPGAVVGREEDAIEAQGNDDEERLVGFLQEILYQLEVRGRIYSEFRVEAVRPSVRARCTGEPLDPARHRLQTDIKAATYHGLAVEKEASPDGPLYRARIVLDI